MFELLNKEIEKYWAFHDKPCEIVIGSETHKELIKTAINPEYETIEQAQKRGYIQQYRGTKLVQGDFEFGYFLK